MIQILIYFLCGALGYFVGAINPSYLVARYKGFDIRSIGSGNAGGSNALITMGKKIGILCMAFDFFKAYFCIRLTTHFSPRPLVFAATALGCELGHLFPFYMKFRGGKGLASLGGIVLAYDYKIFFMLLFAELILLAVTKYLCFVPITAAAVFPIIYGLQKDWVGALMLAVFGVAIILKHRINLRRIRLGCEMRIDYLWNKDSETERVTEKAEELLSGEN